MVNFVRRNKDPYSWSYHNDLIAALGGDLHYHASLGVGAEFDIFLQEFYTVCPKNFSPIHFLSAMETDSELPMMGIITPEFGILRVLEHPLAKEFASFIPWVYRDTFYSMKRLIQQLPLSPTLPELYKNIEDIRWINHKLARRSMLEDIISQLSLIKLHAFWEAIPTELPLKDWLSSVSEKILAIKFGSRASLRLPLPTNENLFVPSIIFWLQLLEAVLKNRYREWKVYWTEGSLLFMSGLHSPNDVRELFEVPVEPGLLFEPSIKLLTTPDITLLKLLSCWGEALKL
jgi:hypothetical protein